MENTATDLGIFSDLVTEEDSFSDLIPGEIGVVAEESLFGDLIPEGNPDTPPSDSAHHSLDESAGGTLFDDLIPTEEDQGWLETLGNSLKNAALQANNQAIGMGRAIGEGMESVSEYLPDSISSDVADLGKTIASGSEAKSDLFEEAMEPLPSDPIKRNVAEVTEAVGGMIPAVAASLIGGPGAGMLFLGGQTFGGKYDESRDEGRTPAESAQDGGVYALTEAIPSALPLGVLTRGGGSVIGTALKGAGAEGAQETLTETLQASYDLGLVDPNISTWDDFEKAMAQESNIHRLMKSGLIGSESGFVLGMLLGRRKGAAGERPDVQEAVDNLNPEQGTTTITVNGETTTKGGSDNSIKGRIVNLARQALGRKSGNDLYEDYATVSDDFAQKANDAVGDLSGYTHVLDESGVRHIANKHGPDTETRADQIPVVEEDYALLPEIVEHPDTISKGGEVNGQQRLVVTKVIGNDYYVVEEIREGRKKLAVTSMWKRKLGDSSVPASPNEAAAERPERPEDISHTENIDEIGGESQSESSIAPPKVHYKTNGEAYSSEKGARAAIKLRNEFNPEIHEPVHSEKGWGITDGRAQEEHISTITPDGMAAMRRQNRVMIESMRNSDVRQLASDMGFKGGSSSSIRKQVLSRLDADAADYLKNIEGAAPLESEIKDPRWGEVRGNLGKMTKMERFRNFIQDKHHSLHRVSEQAKTDGVELTDDSDVETALRLYPGKAEVATSDFKTQHVEPLINRMDEANISIEEMDQYLYARTAPETNRVLHRRNKEGGYSQSGMSDMSADKVMLNFEKSGKSKDLEAIAVQYDAINKHRLDRLEESGLINPVMRKQWGPQR